ncbi:MAG: lipid II flippase MurJ [Ferruginibacter sp.]
MLKTESYKKGIVVSTLLNIVAKGVTFLNTLIITFYFGAQFQTDVYFYIIAVVTLLCSTINGIDLLVLIPESMRIKEQESEKKATQFCNFFLWGYLGLGIFFSILIILGPISFYSLFSKFDTEKLIAYKQMLYFGGVIIIFQLLNGLLTSILTSYKYFTASITAGLINSLFAILFTVVFQHRFGIVATMFGILVGYLINFLILVFVMRKKLKWDFFDIVIMKDKRVWRNIGLIQVNILPVWIKNYLVIFLLTGLGAGVLTALNLAQNIALLPEVFFLTQVASIGGIKFSELNAKKDYESIARLFSYLFTFLLTVIIPIAIVFCICSKELISIAYLRGNFNNDSTVLTAYCFLFLAVIIPFKVADILFSRLFTALQLYSVAVLFAFIAHSLFALLTYMLTTYYKLTGYFWSLIIGNYLFVSVAFILIIKIKASFLIDNSSILKNLYKLSLITVVTSIITYQIKQYINFTPIISVCLISAIVSVLFWVSAYFFLDIEPAKKLLQQSFKKLKFI